MLKGIIFDLDGVIVTTDQYHYQAWKKMADKENIYFDEEINHRLRGVSRMASLEIILEKANKSYTDEEKKALTDYKNDYYKKLLQDLSPQDILPNVLKVLDTLKKNNYKIAIGSSSKNTKLILKQIGLSHSFDAIADGTDIKRSKPHPDVFLIAAERLNLKPFECAVIEDADAGIEAAKNAKMYAIGIGAATNSELCDAKITDIKEVIDIIMKKA